MLITQCPDEVHCTGTAPLIFNEDEYIGQYQEFFSAREVDKGKFYGMSRKNEDCILRTRVYTRIVQNELLSLIALSF